jgi:8-oxo-dGTP diphosphatase
VSGTLDEHVAAAVRADVAAAVSTYDGADAWTAEQLATSRAPLAVEVWVFAPDLDRVLLVDHRWRGWVPPGGKAEPGETPWAAARRELAEETGLDLVLHDRPAAVAVRSYHPDWPATLGLSYAAVADPALPLIPEPAQPAAWTSLAHPWPSAFPDDRARITAHAPHLPPPLS